MSYDYDTLYQDYQGFFMPSFQVVVNKSDKLMKDDNVVITAIQVDLTSSNEASACTFQLQEAHTFNKNNNSFEISKTINDLITLGQPVEVSLGYGETTQLVFKGVITNVSMSYDSGAGVQISVECMDVKLLMMNNYGSGKISNEITKPSEAIKKIVEKYAKFIGKPRISETPEYKVDLEKNQQSDYDFISKLADELFYSFYIVKGELIFEPFGNDTEPIIELHADKLHSFSRDISLTKQLAEVTVRSNDETDHNKPFEYTVKTITPIGQGKKSAAEIASMLKNTAKKTIIDPKVKSVDEAKVRATAEFAKHAMKLCQGRFETIGIPEIIPGKMMKIKGFGKEYDNDYYIKKVTHQLNSSGYLTKGELGVNKI
ncbi:phage late control D family protein [Desulfuribacillus alkaliarsenatis]|uniref:Phage protein D n=1 Tax=Desulfuribacillus alkaliarsenatis TaxID=766136 RepID=A0A1E5G2C5_9FIRM|nr:phage late control D family protein [Desulfuribacillus alkaliarsenatis]OEF97116.1 hypothetical protein BHF68_05835 [Desulfuribacillus alkaliarsenatis]